MGKRGPRASFGGNWLSWPKIPSASPESHDERESDALTLTLVYTYTADGLLMARQVNTDVLTYTWDVALGLPQVLATSDGAQYVHGLDLVAEHRDGEWSYPLGDALGSVRQWTDESGFITYRGDYTPFGVALSSDGSTESAWGYTGEWEDTALDAVYLRARWYQPQVGRFTRQDPWEGNRQQPLTMNPYLYTVGNPLRYTDPHGYAPACLWLGSLFCSHSWYDNPPPGWLDQTSRNLGSWLDQTSGSFGYSLESTGSLIFRQGLANCPPPGEGYCSYDSANQALGIGYDWFFETGSAVQRFGPEEPLTQDVRYSPALDRFRAEWALQGYRLPFSWDEDSVDNRTGLLVPRVVMGASAYARENVYMCLALIGLGSRTPQGRVDAVGGVLGSLDYVAVSDAQNGMVEFVAINVTNWPSGSRFPGTDFYFIEARRRFAPGPGGDLVQFFYWYEGAVERQGFR